MSKSWDVVANLILTAIYSGILSLFSHNLFVILEFAAEGFWIATLSLAFISVLSLISGLLLSLYTLIYSSRK